MNKDENAAVLRVQSSRRRYWWGGVAMLVIGAAALAGGAARSGVRKVMAPEIKAPKGALSNWKPPPSA